MKHFDFHTHRSRHMADTRLGFILHTDRCDVLLSDRDERSSKFNIGLTLCLIWWRISLTIFF